MAEYKPPPSLTAPILVSEFISYRPEMIKPTRTSIQTGRQLSVAITIDGKDLCDPVKAHESCQRYGIDDSHWWGIANSWTQRRGRLSGEGKLLMTAEAYSTIPNPKALVHDIVLRFGGDSVKVSKLSIVDASSAIGSLVRDKELLVDELTAESLLLLTIKDAREHAHHASINRIYNLRQRSGVYDRSTVDESGNPIRAQHILKHIWDTDLQAVFGTSLNFFRSVNEQVHIPEDLIFTGWSAWDAFWYILDLYGWNFTLALNGDGWIFRNDTVNEQIDDELEARNNFLLNTYESVDNSPLPNRLRVFAFSHDYQWYQPAEQPARHATKQFDRLTAGDQVRRFPLYEREYFLSALVKDFNFERLAADNTVSVYCPVPVITNDQGVFVNEESLHKAMDALANEKARQLIYADASENHIFAGLWPFQAGPFYDQVTWIDHGQGIMTRTSIGIGCDAPEPHLFQQHEPAVRWVIARISQASTGQLRVAPDTFCDIAVLSGHLGNAANVNWNSRKQVRAVNATNADLDVNSKVFAVWNYQLGEGGEWCIVASVETSLKEDEVALLRLKGPLDSGSSAQLGAALHSTNCLFDGELLTVQKEPCGEVWSAGEQIVGFDFRGYLPKAVLSYHELYLGVYLGFATSGKKLYGLVAQAPPLQRVKNKSGGKLEQFRPAQITKHVGEAKLFAHHHVVEVYRVIADYGPFCVMAFDCEAEELGWAFIHGLCPAYLNDQDQTHHWADVRADVGNNTLTTGHEGSARIIQRRIEGTASSNLALVNLGELEDVSVCGALLDDLAFGAADGRVRTEGGWVQNDVHHTCISTCDLIADTQIRITFSRVAKHWVVSGIPPSLRAKVDTACIGSGTAPSDNDCWQKLVIHKGLKALKDTETIDGISVPRLKIGTNGIDTSFDVITAISCNNGIITYTKRTLTFICGVLSDDGDADQDTTDCCIVLEGQTPPENFDECMCCGGDCPDCSTCPEELTVDVGSPFTGLCSCMDGTVISITWDGVGTCEWNGSETTGCIDDSSCDFPDPPCDGEDPPRLHCNADCEQPICVDCSEAPTVEENAACCPDNNFGMNVMHANLQCVDGVWYLTGGAGTVGHCPHITMSFSGNRRANGNCPQGTYDCVFVFDYKCDELTCNIPATFNSPVVVA